MQEGFLQSMEVEMLKIRQENEQLKATLGQLINEYKSLEVRYLSIIQQEETNKNLDASKVNDHQESQKHSKFTSLSMGEDSSGTKHENNTETFSKSKEKCTKDHEDLVLRLDCKYNGSNNSEIGENMRNHKLEDSSEEPKDKEEETWSPNKMPRKSNDEDGNDQETPQPTVKRARVSVRARCDTPTVGPCAFNYNFYVYGFVINVVIHLFMGACFMYR
jgi:hypothetical protein